MIAPSCLALALTVLSTAEGASELKWKRLSEVAKVWGVVKFFHPELAYRTDLDWDRALVDALPDLEAAETTPSYHDALSKLLAPLEDPMTYVGPVAGSGHDSPGGDSRPHWEVLEGEIGYLALRDQEALASSGQETLISSMCNAFRKARDTSTLILDLRQRDRETASDMAKFVFARSLRTAFTSLLGKDLILSTTRKRLHLGYSPQQFETSGGYYSAMATTECGWMRPETPGAEPSRLVILTNEGCGEIADIVGAMRAAGRAVVFHEGGAFDSSSFVPFHQIPLSEGGYVIVRTGEIVHSDGSVGFHPLRRGQPSSEGEDDDTLKEAVSWIRGTWAPQAPFVLRRPQPLILREKVYEGMSMPSRPYRLLSLFRLWNIIHYFFPYHHLTDRPWGEILPEYLPQFAEAKNPTSYALAASSMVAHIDDSHGSVNARALGEHLGTMTPPLEVRCLDGQWVVFFVAPGEEDYGLAPGDVIVSVDGQSVEARADFLRPYLPASTPQASNLKISRYLLGGAPGSVARLDVLRVDGSEAVLELARTTRSFRVSRARIQNRPFDVFTVLDEGYGYMDLARLERDQVDEAFALFKDVPAIIVDIRGYPKGTAWSITPWLRGTSGEAAEFHRPFVFSPSVDVHTRYDFVQRYPSDPTKTWDGTLVVLIDEEAISQSEHTCLFLKRAGRDVTFIGTPTNGANGDITRFPLPGGLWVIFTGQEVQHVGGEQLQRRGIQPDILVEPTCEGLHEGIDEVMEVALEFLDHGR